GCGQGQAAHLRVGDGRPGRGRRADRTAHVARPLSAVKDLWREADTTPGRIEAALRNMFIARHKEERAYVPARVMNMVVIADREFRGEVENRLQRVGRYHPSRLLLVLVDPGRTRLAAGGRAGAGGRRKPGGGG